MEEESDEDADDERVEEGADADEAESVAGGVSARTVVAVVESAIVAGVSIVVAGGDADSFDGVEPDVISFDAAANSRGDADSDIETPLVQFMIAAGI
ncbi:hypothetical protein C484_11291 [Natrialba taiwanensis DSM 12281]|uniref:Uncharacterized protein n=1 Tax=Natrialba taiwanensis DSM 12281 TaxID=1230458 RepID=L9ZWR7_9EURY|nr:hypothetical protein C484_11291 [Natrialba taiwanensis DSM 12281]